MPKTSAHLRTAGLPQVFALAFAVFRLGGGSLAALRFYQGGTHPLLGYLMLVGAALQWWWGLGIALKVKRSLFAVDDSKGE